MSSRLAAACVVAWGAGLAACTPSDLPSAIKNGVKLIEATESVPKVREHVTLPDGRTASRMSRTTGLKEFVAKNAERLEKVDTALKELERSGGVWADDAAVVRGYLCALTAEGAGEDRDDPTTLYRSLVVRPVEIELETWTRQSLLAIDTTAGKNSFLEAATSDAERVAIAFSGYLILHTVRTEGAQKAYEVLGEIRASGRVSDELATYLQQTIDRYEDFSVSAASE